MGQYIQVGICCKVKISKIKMENSIVSYEEVIDGLGKEIPLNLYKVKETDNSYNFILKEEILENSQLPEFLLGQYKLFGAEGDRIEEIICKLNKLNKFDDIISFSEQKKYENFQYTRVYNYIYCGKWEHSVMVEYELITFFLAGKIMMECYNRFLKYIEALIHKDNTYKVSEAIKVFIG